MGETDPRPDAKHVARCKELYELLIEPLRAIARRNGYALAVHGSLERDIDLIAVPWTQMCSQPVCLAEAIRDKAAELNGGIAFQNPSEATYYRIAGSPGAKPHGRLGWAFHLGGGPYIDLSVIPPSKEP